MYPVESGAAKPIAEPVKQENSMPTPPPTTNGHIGPQDAATTIVSPSSQNVSHTSIEEPAGTEIAAEATLQTAQSDKQQQSGQISESDTIATKKEDPEMQRTSAPEAFDEVTPTAATPSSLPQAEASIAKKKQVRAKAFNSDTQMAQLKILCSPIDIANRVTSSNSVSRYFASHKYDKGPTEV